MSGASKLVHAIIDYKDPYVQPLILAAVKNGFPSDRLEFSQSVTDIPSPDRLLLQWRQYEEIDLEHALEHPETSLINAFVYRKALIRKHYLSRAVSEWIVKHPTSCLSSHVKPSNDFEVDYAEFLDDALVEAFELRASMEQNISLEPADRQWWILKPGMSERGQGIQLFSTEEDLTSIFEKWEPDESDEDEDGGHGDSNANGIITSQLRHFVAQPYIHPPLLLDGSHESAGKKFHIRTYVLAVGAMKIYVYRPMLALFAGQTYTPPWKTDDPNEDLAGHLTNTCLQSGEREGSVCTFASLPDQVPNLASAWKEDIIRQICATTAEVFEAAARGMMVHFQPLPNAFEIYGLDFLVDAKGTAWLLEVNAFPDFAQTGKELQPVIKGLFDGVVDCAIKPFFQAEHEKAKNVDMMQVLDIDLGRR